MRRIITCVAAVALIATLSPAGVRVPRADASASAYYCNTHLAHFVDVVSTIDGHLQSDGYTFREYQAAYSQGRVAINRIPWTQVSHECLGAVGLPAARALKEYGVARNIWAACVAKMISDGSCDPESGDARRRRAVQWLMAHRNVARAVNNLAN